MQYHKKHVLITCIFDCDKHFLSSFQSQSNNLKWHTTCDVSGARLQDVTKRGCYCTLLSAQSLWTGEGTSTCNRTCFNNTHRQSVCNEKKSEFGKKFGSSTSCTGACRTLDAWAWCCGNKTAGWRFAYSYNTYCQLPALQKANKPAERSPCVSARRPLQG